MRIRRSALIVIAILAACWHAAPAAAETSGSFSALTYNVAGLPQGISSGNPAVNTGPIGRRTGAYDLVHVQEDFNYHGRLAAEDAHPFETVTSGIAGIGSGLNTFSAFPFSDLDRVRWGRCAGTDCLTPKGFTRMRVRLAEGAYLDAYNVHANAGTGVADLAARRANIAQLSGYIARNSAGNAVLVMGDTNTRYTRAADTIRDLAARNGLTDAWVQTQRAGTPPAAGEPALVCDEDAVTSACEVVDKIMFRGSRAITLALTAYSNDHAGFLDATDKPLSDHYPIAARFSWSLNPDIRLTDQWGGPHGDPFTDIDVLEPAGPRAVSLRAGAWVDQVALTTASGAVMAHGGPGGAPASLTLGPGEAITSLRVDRARRLGRTRVFYVAFTTTAGRTLAGGRPTADTTTYTAPAGWQISGLQGRASGIVDRLGAIFTPR